MAAENKVGRSFCGSLTIKEVAYSLHVDLEIAALNREFDFGISFTDLLEQVLKHSRDETLKLLVVKTRALHRKRLARACLSVAKDRSIVSIEYTIDRWNCNFLEDACLACLRPKHTVE